MRELYLMRHGETDLNRSRKIQGRSSDSPLNERGKKEVQAFYFHHRSLKFDKVYCSSLLRSRESVQKFRQSQIPVCSTPLLDEISWGDFEGQYASTKMKRDFKRMLKSWANGDLNLATPGGESAQEVLDRIDTFISNELNKSKGKLLISAHGWSLKFLIFALTDIPLKELYQWSFRNSSITQLSFDPLENRNTYKLVKKPNCDYLMKSNIKVPNS